MPADHYLADEDYQRLVDAIAHLEPSHITGEPDQDAIKAILGEIGGVWPAAIAPANGAEAA